MRSIVAGIHGLQHVERFLAAHLADDDSVGTHTQGIDDQFALPYSPLSFNVRRPAFQAYNVLLLQLKFGGVFNRDDAFVSPMYPLSTFSRVVLPAPVPPEMTMLSLARTAALNARKWGR